MTEQTTRFDDFVDSAFDFDHPAHEKLMKASLDAYWLKIVRTHAHYNQKITNAEICQFLDCYFWYLSVETNKHENCNVNMPPASHSLIVRQLKDIAGHYKCLTGKNFIWEVEAGQMAASPMAGVCANAAHFYLRHLVNDLYCDEFECSLNSQTIKKIKSFARIAARLRLTNIILDELEILFPSQSQKDLSKIRKIIQKGGNQ